MLNVANPVGRVPMVAAARQPHRSAGWNSSYGDPGPPARGRVTFDRRPHAATETGCSLAFTPRDPCSSPAAETQNPLETPSSLVNGADYPLTTPRGTKRATTRASPAPSVASTTASTSLYASGVSSASARSEAGRTAMPCASSAPRT